jgi:hypothetical protein
MIFIKNVTILAFKTAQFLSGAKLLLFCQPHNTIYYEKVHDY